jgi:hypothetical protein
VLVLLEILWLSHDATPRQPADPSGEWSGRRAGTTGPAATLSHSARSRRAQRPPAMPRAGRLARRPAPRLPATPPSGRPDRSPKAECLEDGQVAPPSPNRGDQRLDHCLQATRATRRPTAQVGVTSRLGRGRPVLLWGRPEDVPSGAGRESGLSACRRRTAPAGGLRGPFAPVWSGPLAAPVGVDEVPAGSRGGGLRWCDRRIGRS